MPTAAPIWVVLVLCFFLLGQSVLVWFIDVPRKIKERRERRKSRQAQITQPVTSDVALGRYEEKPLKQGLQRLMQKPEWLKSEPLLSDSMMRKWSGSDNPITFDCVRDFLKDCLPHLKYHHDDAKARELITEYHRFEVETAGGLYDVMRRTIIRRYIIRSRLKADYAFYEINRAMIVAYPSSFDTLWRASEEERRYFDAVRELSDWETEGKETVRTKVKPERGMYSNTLSDGTRIKWHAPDTVHEIPLAEYIRWLEHLDIVSD